jgi:NAD(P)-dependent dehydrogenase (short-subunit alcohol dehydrogenase family)
MPPRMDLQGRQVVITGGSGALGAAVIAALRARGAVLHLPVVEPGRPAHLPDDADVRVTPGVSLTDEAAVERFYGALPSLWGSIHVAGGFAMQPIAELRLADYERMHALNGVTCLLSCREAVRAMRRAGGGGRIVNVTSRSALAPSAGSLAYTASKAEVAAITQALAAEVLADGILVNAVAPSIMDTPANRAAMPGADFASWPTTAQVAETIAFLVSPANALTSGTIVPVYGRA